MNGPVPTWDADAKQIEALRRLGMTGRLKLAFRMHDFARQITLTIVRSKHPDWSEAHVKMEVRRRMGDENWLKELEQTEQWNNVKPQ